jgi:hypothetical protein
VFEKGGELLRLALGPVHLIPEDIRSADERTPKIRIGYAEWVFGGPHAEDGVDVDQDAFVVAGPGDRKVPPPREGLVVVSQLEARLALQESCS